MANHTMLEKLAPLCLLLAACGVSVPASSPAPERGGAPVEAAAPEPASSVCGSPTAEVARLVERLDEDFDPLHTDMTPSVLALSELDLPGACAVLDRLEAEDADTRLHAQRVLERVLTRRCRFSPGFGFEDQYGEEGARATLGEIGYAYDADLPARHAAARRWRRWVEEAEEAACDGAGSGPPPSALRAALDAVQEELRRCGEPVDVRATFGQDGSITSIFGQGRTADYNRCVEAAAGEVSVPAFERESVWIRYTPDRHADQPE